MLRGSRITPQVVQAVRESIDIVDIANELTRLQKKGKRYLGLCPFHKEKTPSFSVDPEQGLFYCFGCGEGGDAIKLYQQNSGDDFPAAIESLAQRYGIPLPEVGASPADQRRSDHTAVLEAAAAFFRQSLLRSDIARSYLENRQIPKALAESFGLGYAPQGWHELQQELGRRFPLDALVETGLVGRSDRTGEPYDRFRHRLIFPIHTPAGRLVGFGGRTLGEDRAKYVNTPETDAFRKGQLLYGFHLAKRDLRDGSKALLVEGYFDVLGAAASGIPWSVAGMGTALTADQARLLARYTDEVIVAYDGDPAGEKAFQRSLPILLASGLGVRRARFPAGHDPDSLRLEKGPEEVQRLVDQAIDGVELEIDRLIPDSLGFDPRSKTKIASAIGEVIQPMRDNILRQAYGQRAAERLGVPIEMLFRRFGPAPPPENPSLQKPAAQQVSRAGAEENAVVLMLRPGTAIPPFERLPPKEIFFDEQCRNIYAAFCALYKDGEPTAPVSSAVIAELDPESGAIDRAAQLLLKVSDSDEVDLQATLDTLLRRWQKCRRSELQRQLREAEEQQDRTRLDQLLEEQKSLIRSLHPAMTGKLW